MSLTQSDTDGHEAAPQGGSPRDRELTFFRGLPQGLGLRAADTTAGEPSGPTMVGHFAVFNQPTEINSVFEGRFIEQFVPGAFRKTIRENRDGMRVLFQHGADPQVGDKPLGPITDLREDDEGAYYEVPLLDADYVRGLVLPGLEADLYGASFRFRVVREEVVEDPEPSDANPHGLPERTVKEAQVMEFGPVTFPAYKGASAGVRCTTDSVIYRWMANHPGWIAEHPEYFRNIAELTHTREAETARAVEEEGDACATPEDGAGAEPHPAHGSRDNHLYGERLQVRPPWLL